MDLHGSSSERIICEVCHLNGDSRFMWVCDRCGRLMCQRCQHDGANGMRCQEVRACIAHAKHHWETTGSTEKIQQLQTANASLAKALEDAKPWTMTEEDVSALKNIRDLVNTDGHGDGCHCRWCLVTTNVNIILNRRKPRATRS